MTTTRRRDANEVHSCAPQPVISGLKGFPLCPECQCYPECRTDCPDHLACIARLNGEPTEPSRALRFNKGKAELHYLMTFPEAVRGLAAVSTYGAGKYALYNYTKGSPLTESVNCAMRHLLAWFNGEDTDPESGCHHLDHFVWNAMRLAQEAKTRPDLDDRPHMVKAQQQTQGQDAD